MNISLISFKGDNNRGLDVDIPNWVNNRHPQSRRVTSQYERTPERDTFYSSERQTNRPTSRRTGRTSGRNNKKKQIIPVPLKTFAAGVLAALAVTQGAQVINQPSDVISIPVDSSTSLTEIAQNYDSDIDAILSYNDLAEEADISELDSIKVPSSYDYLQNEIDKLQDKLYHSNLSPEERAEIEDKIAEYKEKQQLQQSIANVYTDGKYVYYTIIDIPEDIGYSSINVEKFKDIFDIKDGALKKYNDIDYTWAFDEDAPPEDEGYRDYTVASLKVGDTVKVRQGDIQVGADD